MKNGIYYTGVWIDGTGIFYILLDSEDFPSFKDREDFFPKNAYCLEWQLWRNNKKIVSHDATGEFTKHPRVCNSLAGNELLTFSL